MARVCMSAYIQVEKMQNQRFFRLLLLYNILESVYHVVLAIDGRSQGMLTAEQELNQYVEDGVFHLSENYVKSEDVSAVSFANLEEENLNTYASPVLFQPAMLNFNSHPVGMPHMERVIVKNLSPDTTIHMLSISGNTLHLYCSFFQEKVIPPGGNTSFDVVFLARQEGPVENILFIHTSLGSFKYQVTAVGTTNPYRLRPFIGVRMPLNSSYTPVIHMHNPYPSTLQLTEMYTSGGDLHLELPDGDTEASRNVWVIPPYETKPIIKANFIARVEKNHTAFIRIRTNGSNTDYLVLPVEVDVTSVPGIYSPTEILDFGILRSHDPAKILTLSLLNSGQKHIHIVNVIVTPVNEAVDVKFMPVKIPPDTVFSTQVATVTLNPSKLAHLKQCSGKIVIKSKNNQFKLHIPYQVQLIRGSLDYNKNSTRFYVGPELASRKIDIKELNITNNFDVTIVIYNISFPEKTSPHFTVRMKHPVVLSPGETLSSVTLTFHPACKNLQLTTHLRLHTNVSYFDIPLLCFSGHLKLFLPQSGNDSYIDFGTLGMSDKRTTIFAVINDNPVDVNLKMWGSNISKSYVELVGIDKGNASALVWKHNFSSVAHSLVLKPHHYAIFRISITAPSQEGIFNGHAFVETQHEKIIIPFSLRTAKGGLRVDDMFFGNIFPGKISTLNFYVHSSFSHSMTLTGVSCIPEDNRLSFDPLRHSPPVLYPNAKNLVGKIHFDLRKHCRQKCYSGLPTTTSMGHQWLLGMSLPPDVVNMDRELFKTLNKRWKKLIDLEGKSVNLTLSLDTTEVRGHLLKASAVFQWPRLFNKQHLKFQVTQIGNHTVKDFTLENPSSLPLIVQVAPLSTYPKPQEVLNILSEKFGGKLMNLKHMTTDPDVFTLEDLEENNKNSENHIPAYRKSIEEYFGVQSHKQSIAILLTPGMRVRINVGFTPKDDLFRSSLILVRNNLTVLDAFLVQGQGGHGEIKFGNISPGSNSSLIFELTDKHLKDCNGVKNTKFSTPNFTVRKPFMARNTGALPVFIQGFDISGKPCEGYGFRVLNCDGFELKPNESKRVDIVFTPDFTLTRVDRTLNIHTSHSPPGHALHFNLVATIPRHMLSPCSKILPRPIWEHIIYYIFNIGTSFLILGLVILAHIESQKILRSAYFPIATIAIHQEKMDKGNMFDLKALNSSTIESNSNAKNVKNRPADTKKLNAHSKLSSVEISSSSSSLSSSSSSSSHFTKKAILPPKNKDLSHTKEYEENSTNGNSGRSKKKSAKLRQLSDGYILEPELIEIKKSQPRNSWTRFLKPPFSFTINQSSVTSKPSVATQTSNNEAEENVLKGPDVALISNNNNNNSNGDVMKNKNKKKDVKYEHKNSIKKDSVPEEETSSTTTEISTTESEVSEKDHQLPDVCVTSKVQKSHPSKNKAKDRNSQGNTTVRKIETSVVTDSDGFELSTKSRAHKKIKVNPSEAFAGDILHPSTLELPYKPKTVNEKRKPAECFTPGDSSITYSSRKSRGSASFNTSPPSPPISNSTLQTELRSSGWPMTTVPESTFTTTTRNNASSYSAVLSKDISVKHTEKPSTTNYHNNTFMPVVGTSRPTPPPSTSTVKSNNLGHRSNFMDDLNCPVNFNPPQISNDLSSSKLRNWMSHGASDHFISGAESFQPRKDDSDSIIPDTYIDPYSGSNLNLIWGHESNSPSISPISPKSGISKNNSEIYNGWSTFEPLSDEKMWNSKPSTSSNFWSMENYDSAPKSVKHAQSGWSIPNTTPIGWNNSSKVWSPHSQDNMVSPIGNMPVIAPTSTSPNLDLKFQETSSDFSPFNTLSNLWSLQLNNPDACPSTNSNEPSNPNWSFSLFSDAASPGSDGTSIHSDKEDPKHEENPDNSN